MKLVKICKLPKVNLFQFSLSCVSYSVAGRQRGARGKEGGLARYGASYVRSKKPDCFVMEQVTGFVKCFPREANSLKKRLTQSGEYKLAEYTLDASVHGSLPQRRVRWFLVGVRLDVLGNSTMPRSLSPVPMLNLSSLLNKKGKMQIPTDKTCSDNLVDVLKRIQAMGGSLQGSEWVADLQSTKASLQDGVAPTLTASRCSAKGFYLVSRMRWTKVSELLKLQGMLNLDFGTLSKAKVGRMIGNGIPVTLLMRIFSMLLRVPQVSLTTQTFSTPWD